MKWVKNTYRILCNAEQIISGTCLMLGTSILCVGAVMRTAGHPISAISEVSLFLFAWCILLGADVAFRGSGLVRVEIFIQKLKSKHQKPLALLTGLLIEVFLATLFWQSVLLTEHSWVRKWASLPKISYGWIALCLPVGCALMMVTNVIHMVHVAKSMKQDSGFSAE